MLQTIRQIALSAAGLVFLSSCSSSDDLAATLSYTTQFDGAESPISEGGIWSNNGLDWTPVRKENGIAFGTQSGAGGYDDSYAKLSGFLPNQTVEAKIYLIKGIDPSCSHEVELLLRWSDFSHSAKGYVVNMSFNGSYIQIVR